MLISNEYFNLFQTFECGQCFRWNANADGSYSGTAGGFFAKLSCGSSGIVLQSNAPDSFWQDYFDLSRDYCSVNSTLSRNHILAPAARFGKGIRILRQPFFECLISFIISQNNNISRIKKIVESLCFNFGTAHRFGNIQYYAFPTPEQLHGRDLSVIKCGFRLRYINDAVSRVLSGEISYEHLSSLSSDDARVKLKTICGVGSKVADCVLLFSLGRFDVFPKDVWVKRTMKLVFNLEENEIDTFAASNFAGYAGLAQQYLFFYARENDLKSIPAESSCVLSPNLSD